MTDAPDNIADLRRDLKRALDLLDKRASDYEKGAQFYEGTRAEVAASAEVARIVGSSAQAAPVSFAHIPVDVIIDKVEFSGIDTTDATAKARLAEVFDANDLDDELDDMLKKAGYFGDYYAIIDPLDEDDNGNAGEVRIVGSSPLTTVVVYDERDQRTPDFGAKVWAVSGKRHRAVLFYDDVTVKLVTPENMDSRRADDFNFDVDDTGETASAFQAHKGEALLVKHLAIDGKPYGTPLHRKAWGPQDAITKISATNLANVDGQGLPARWALADLSGEIDDDIDDDFGTDGPGTDPTKSDGQRDATNGSVRVRTTPGFVSILRGVKAVGQFDATDSENFLKNLDWYVRAMAVACGVALFEFDLTGEQPSGESRRRAEARSVRKADKVKRAAGAFVRDIADTVLGLSGSTAEVTVTFKPSETATDKEGLELVAAKIKTGVPIPTALLEAGYTDEQVTEWFPDKAVHLTPEALSLLAPALAALGQAKTLGVLTDADLAAMLPELLTGPRPEATVAPVAPATPPARSVAAGLVRPA